VGPPRRCDYDRNDCDHDNVRRLPYRARGDRGESGYVLTYSDRGEIHENHHVAPDDDDRPFAPRIRHTLAQSHCCYLKDLLFEMSVHHEASRMGRGCE
jgi:hypothetical protein